MELVEMQTVNKGTINFVQPLIYTQRLILRPLSDIDARVLHFLANEKLVAANIFSSPFPVTQSLAQQWIKLANKNFNLGVAAVFGIAENNNGNLLGTIELSIDKKTSIAQMSYWIAKDYWGHGYCSEAALNLVQYGFENLGIQKIYSGHCVHNLTAAKVFNSIGMTNHGLKKNYMQKGSRPIDVYIYSLNKEDFIKPKVA